MDYEIKLKCKNCKTELTELTVYVHAGITLTWNDDDNQYEAHCTDWDTDEVNEYICPECSEENIIDPNIQKTFN